MRWLLQQIAVIYLFGFPIAALAWYETTNVARHEKWHAEHLAFIAGERDRKLRNWEQLTREEIDAIEREAKLAETDERERHRRRSNRRAWSGLGLLFIGWGLAVEICNRLLGIRIDSY